LAGGGGSYSGPPRLVGIGAKNLDLNGVPIAQAHLGAALAPLMTKPEDLVILRGRDAADVQRIIDITTLLRAAGYSNVVLVE